jgi:ABC-type nitrate/sulfonate/bicarbonate transport system permease component
LPAPDTGLPMPSGILYASGTLDTPTLYFGIIALAVFAAILSFAVDAMGPLLVHWRFADEK